MAGLERRPDLQGMRAVAVLAVFANHLFGWPSGGFVGVDIFFVLSGFFITGLLNRELMTTGSLSFRNFYIRRVKRILPSALLVLVVTVTAGYLLFPANRARETLLDALYAAVFVSNFRFEAIGADYFQAGQPPSPVQHYWSLSIEEQFYFIWPALMVLIFALANKHWKRRKARANDLGLVVVMSVVVVASFIWATYLSASNPNSAYFSSLTRVWELGLGAILAITGRYFERIPSAARPFLAYFGLVGCFGSFLVIHEGMKFPAPWAALPVLCAALVVVSFHGSPVRSMFPLTNRIARYFGDTSYTLYLWHFPVIILLLAITPRGWAYYALAMILALGLTAATYHFYENPIRNSNWLLERGDRKALTSRRLPSLTFSWWSAIGAVGVVAVVLTILGVNYADKVTTARQEIAVAAGKSSGARVDQPATEADPCFGAPAMVNRQCALWNPDIPLQPSIDEFAQDGQDGWVARYCDKGKSEVPTRSFVCGYREADAKRVAIVGDSHAGALLPALLPILDENKWELSAYIGRGCYLAEPSSDVCQRRMDEIKAELVANPYDLVIVTNWAGAGRPPDYERAWAPVAGAGSRIVVVRDNPATTEEAIQCLTRVSFGGDRTGECGTPLPQAFPRSDPLVEAARQTPGVTVIDLSRYFCNDMRCPSVIGNVIVYRDQRPGGNTHITGTFAETLSPAMGDELRRVFGE